MLQLHLICSNSFEAKLIFISVFFLAFHALLRVGEIAISKGNTKAKLIQMGDVKLQSNKIHLNIRQTKTEQLGLSTTLTIQASQNPSCPYSAMPDYLLVRQTPISHDFAIFQDNPWLDSKYHKS